MGKQEEELGGERERERNGEKDFESIILSCVWLAITLIIFIIYIPH